MILLGLAIAGLVLAAIPAILFCWNLWLYKSPPSGNEPPGLSRRKDRRDKPGGEAQAGLPAGAHAGVRGAVSVLIPARNEEKVIAAAVESALASKGVELEVVVLDDGSEDATASLVESLARRDPRVRLVRGPPLPAGWCGKQHACWVLAQSARYPLLAFVDADVRLLPDGLARLAFFLRTSGADLVSGVPRQESGTWLESLILPLIHFILLGFLPLARMRTTCHPAYAAGCGQLFLTTCAAYERTGGHAAIRTSLHDGITLPRAYRRAGLRTDLCDATDLATCRMYHGAGPLWQGLAKNTVEGLGKPALIGPATLLLLGGQVLPVLLWLAWPWLTPATSAVNALATLAAFAPRLLGMRRFRHRPGSVLLHPLGVAILVAIQWHGLFRAVLGKPACWKGRAAPPMTR